MVDAEDGERPDPVSERLKGEAYVQIRCIDLASHF